MSIEKLKTIANELEAAQQKVRDFAATEGKTAIGAAFQNFFELATCVTKVVWRQYTPYFNDGDSCEFGVHEPEVFVKSDDQSARYLNDEMEHWHTVSPGSSYWTSDRVDESNAKLLERYGSREAVDAFWEVWSNLPSDLLEAVFGDHVQITVTREDVQVESYSHD